MEIKNKAEQTLLDYYEAFHNKDWDKFRDFLAPEFSYFTDNVSVMNKERFIDFLRKDKWQPKKYNVSNIKVHVSENNDLAFASCLTSFTGSFDTEEITIFAAETTILTKINNKWKILHSHTSNKT